MHDLSWIDGSQNCGKSHAHDGSIALLDKPMNACTGLYVVVLPAVLVLLHGRTLNLQGLNDLPDSARL
jgi:hypothetical protein